MMDRIAVILRGHFRTWNYVKPVVFEFYESIATNVEYYIVSETSATFYNVVLDFQNKTLVKAIQVPAQQEFNTSWLTPAWQSYNIVPYKKQREIEIEYDAVFDTRFDVIYKVIPGKPIIPPEPMTLYTSGFTTLKGSGTLDNSDVQENYYIGLRDHFFMMKSDVYDIFSHRYILPSGQNCHAAIKKICMDRNIGTNSINWMTAFIVRPDAFELFPDPRNYRDSTRWFDLSVAEKIELLVKYKINISDYETSSPSHL